MQLILYLCMSVDVMVNGKQHITMLRSVQTRPMISMFVGVLMDRYFTITRITSPLPNSARKPVQNANTSVNCVNLQSTNFTQSFTQSS